MPNDFVSREGFTPSKRVEDPYNLSVPSVLLRAFPVPTVPQNQRVTFASAAWQFVRSRLRTLQVDQPDDAGEHSPARVTRFGTIVPRVNALGTSVPTLIGSARCGTTGRILPARPCGSRVSQFGHGRASPQAESFGARTNPNRRTVSEYPVTRPRIEQRAHDIRPS